MTLDTLAKKDTSFPKRTSFLLNVQAEPPQPKLDRQFPGQASRSSIRLPSHQIAEEAIPPTQDTVCLPQCMASHLRSNNRKPTTVVVRTTKRYSRNISANEKSLTD